MARRTDTTILCDHCGKNLNEEPHVVVDIRLVRPNGTVRVFGQREFCLMPATDRRHFEQFMRLRMEEDAAEQEAESPTQPVEPPPPEPTP
jgi:hypothetical protein